VLGACTLAPRCRHIIENVPIAYSDRVSAPWRSLLLAGVITAVSASAAAQQLATRVAILQAEDRRAASARDLATLRSGARSNDGQTARLAVRALGRLERPGVMTDILAALSHRLPEVRTEAANAAAQAAQGLRLSASGAVSIPSVQGALINRLAIESEPEVRAALCESIARLPYTQSADVLRAGTTLVELAPKATSIVDRLGLAKGLEAFVRLQRNIQPPGGQVVAVLKELVRIDAARPDQDVLRDARVRRLALESLITIEAADPATVSAASTDPDMQVRRLAVRAAVIEGTDAVLARSLNDPAPMVRIEALRTLRSRSPEKTCSAALSAASDPDTNVALVAIDQLGACAQASNAVAYLASAVSDLADAEAPRNWHRFAHALVALATCSPERAVDFVGAAAASRVWQLRMYAARAAGILKIRHLLERLTHDAEDNVTEAALSALSIVAGHDADSIYVSALDRQAYQVVRAAALALERSPHADAAMPALKSALLRVGDDARPGAADARAALRSTMTSLGVTLKATATPVQPAAPLDAAELRRLAAPRARFTIRDVGTFDVALFTIEAPATVLRFAELVTSGYYDGLTFHRVVPNGIIQGGSPGANEFVSNAPLMRDEVGLWPHVRGSLGISTRGRDTGDAQFFVDLVDNPRYDHTYTVFAQVLNGLDVVDRILEGDVIERVEIVP
jgi:cyclophilin family peptidyl-prolyl cis-trans isomerase